MSALCSYAGALGEPGQGIHRPRLAGLAAADLIATGLAAYFIARVAGHARPSPGFIPFAVVFILLMVLAIFVHEAFCVKTRLNMLIKRFWARARGPPRSLHL